MVNFIGSANPCIKFTLIRKSHYVQTKNVKTTYVNLTGVELNYY
jgi:hypothetical protein